jgi:hypothetical protein
LQKDDAHFLSVPRNKSMLGVSIAVNPFRMRSRMSMKISSAARKPVNQPYSEPKAAAAKTVGAQKVGKGTQPWVAAKKSGAMSKLPDAKSSAKSKVESKAVSPAQQKRLEKLKHAQKLLPLAEAAYTDKSPKGYHRASTDPAALKKLGLTPQDLDPKDPKSGFKAEVFLPDDKNGKPVVSFRGTNVRPDAGSNLKQLVGKEEDSYNRAMQLAAKLKKNGVDAEFTGHSLGGGLAAAAARATGKNATTFNASGVHPLTVPTFLEKNGLPNLPKSSAVTNIAQKGDIVTTLQQNRELLSEKSAKKLIGVVDFAARGVDVFDAVKSSNPFAPPKERTLSKPENEAIDALKADPTALRRAPLASGETVEIKAHNPPSASLTPEAIKELNSLVEDGNAHTVARDIGLLNKVPGGNGVETETQKWLNESVRRHNEIAPSLDAAVKELEASI